MFRKALLPLAALLTVVLLSGCGTAATSLKVSAAYADNLQTIGARSTNPPSFPNPWQGGSNVNFKGTGDKFDSGAIRIENTGGSEATVDQVVVNIGSRRYDLWGSNLKVPANGSLILTQTELGTANPPQPNFDTSEPSNGPANAATGSAAAGAATGSSAVPVIHIKVNGSTTDVRDDARILTTGGTDKGNQPGTPNESSQWQQIGTVSGGSADHDLSPLLLFAPLAAMLLALFSFIPKLIGALILLAIGWWLAKLVARLVVGLLDRLGFGAAAERTGMFGFMGASTAGRRGSQPSWLIGEIVKWFVFLIFVELAAQALGLRAVSVLLHRVILWIPNLVVALLILFIAVLAAQFVGRLVRGGARRNAGFLGSLAEYGIIALAAVVALNQLGIGAVFVDILFAAVIAALALAAGLAFGLGGRSVTSRIWRNSSQAIRTPQPPSRPPTPVSPIKNPTPIESGRQH